MTSPEQPSPASSATETATGPVSAEARAVMLMEAHRLQQVDDTARRERNRTLSRAVQLVFAVLFGAIAGGVAGAARGHAVAGALLLGGLGGLIHVVRHGLR